MRAGSWDGEWDPGLRWRGLAVVCAAMVISAVDMTIVNVALPDISRELDATFGELQWVLDGLLVALAGMHASFLGVMFLVPQYLQYVQERSALVAGVAMFPVGLGVALGPVCCGGCRRSGGWGRGDRSRVGRRWRRSAAWC